MFRSLSCLSKVFIAEIIFSVEYSLTAFSISSPGLNTLNSAFSFPTSFVTSLINLHMPFISSCANIMASSISISGTSFAPASTIIIASSVPATVRSMSDSALCSVAGFMINSPLILPTLTEPVGPSQGMSEIDNATEDPIIAAISGEQSWSTLITVAITDTSFLYPFGKRGLKGLSINLDVSVPCSPGLPSLLIYPPGIFPTAYIFSS